MNWLKRLLRRRRSAVTRRWRKTAKQAIKDVAYLHRRVGTIHQEVDHDWKQTIESTRQRHDEQVAVLLGDVGKLQHAVEQTERRLEEREQKLQEEKLTSRLLEQDNAVHRKGIETMAKQYEALVARVERFTAMESAKRQGAPLLAEQGSVHDQLS